MLTSHPRYLFDVASPVAAYNSNVAPTHSSLSVTGILATLLNAASRACMATLVQPINRTIQFKRIAISHVNFGRETWPAIANNKDAITTRVIISSGWGSAGRRRPDPR